MVARAGVTSLGVLLVGCGGAVTQFEPVHTSGRAAATYSVTSYKLKIGGSVLGDAVVWSEGAEDVSPSEQVLDVEISIRNTTHTPLEVVTGGRAVSVKLRDGRTESLGNPRLVGGSRTVAPDSSGRVGLHYALPRGLHAYDVKGFEFNWRVASLVGDYAQTTAFVALSAQGSEAFADPRQVCGGVYRADPHECVGVPPLLYTEYFEHNPEQR